VNPSLDGCLANALARIVDGEGRTQHGKGLHRIAGIDQVFESERSARIAPIDRPHADRRNNRPSHLAGCMDVARAADSILAPNDELPYVREKGTRDAGNHTASCDRAEVVDGGGVASLSGTADRVAVGDSMDGRARRSRRPQAHQREHTVRDQSQMRHRSHARADVAVHSQQRIQGPPSGSSGTPWFAHRAAPIIAACPKT